MFRHLVKGGSSIRNEAGRLALNLEEAAESLGVSRDFFDEHVRPELRVVRRGRRVLIPITSLQSWLDKSSSDL